MPIPAGDAQNLQARLQVVPAPRKLATLYAIPINIGFLDSMPSRQVLPKCYIQTADKYT